MPAVLSSLRDKGSVHAQPGYPGYHSAAVQHGQEIAHMSGYFFVNEYFF